MNNFLQILSNRSREKKRQDSGSNDSKGIKEFKTSQINNGFEESPILSAQ